MTDAMADHSGAKTTWTTRKLLNWTAEHFAAKAVDSPRLAAEMLLAHVLGVPRIKLYMDLDRPASPLERLTYRELVERAADHEPVQYLVGQAFFYSLALKVDRRVLIPRPSTESLVEHVIEHSKRSPGFVDPVIADIGTGSGAIAIALAANLPAARVIASDINPDALALARENAARHGVADRIDFRQGPLYEPLAELRFSFIVSNPPYIPDDEWHDVPPNVKNFEPAQALRAGPDGMDVLNPLIDDAARYLADPGQIVFEIASSRKHLAVERVKKNPKLTDAKVLADHEGKPRVLIADRK